MSSSNFKAVVDDNTEVSSNIVVFKEWGTITVSNRQQNPQNYKTNGLPRFYATQGWSKKTVKISEKLIKFLVKGATVEYKDTAISLPCYATGQFKITLPRGETIEGEGCRNLDYPHESYPKLGYAL